jgi:peptidoglycan/xylan/chitin deacetylase (PgdA/CDA1 family)
MRPRAAVFYFHDVVPTARLGEIPPTHRPYAVTPEEFRAYLLAAARSPRQSVVAGRIPGELGGPFYGVTFDDGRASDHHEAFPVLCELGIRATFFVVPTLVGTPGYVTWSELREMVAAGMEIGSHSLTHPFVDALGEAELRLEFGESKRILEDRLGCTVRTGSLPRGWAPPVLEPVLRELGYRVFCTSRVGWWHPGDAPLAVPRVAVRPGMPIEEFVAILNAEPRALWTLQALDVAKNAAKACLGRRGWNRLRTPLMRFRYSEEQGL